MSHDNPAATRTGRALGRLPLGAFWLFTAIAVAGYATFGLHPELLPKAPGAMETYGAAFTFFPRAHVILAFLVLAIALVRHAGVRWIPAFAALYLTSLVSELAGTTVGLPFGPYRYTDGLGPKWFGHVPLLIPLSWFFMAVPSYLLARRAVPYAARRGGRGKTLGIVVGSLILLAWDLALDPAMSWSTKYWVWGSAGPYYGMPLLNLFGWYVTGLALMGALATLGADEWGARISTRWLASFYLANLALPLGMIVASGLWWAVLATVAGVALAFATPRLLSSGGRYVTASRSTTAGRVA